MKRQWQMRFLIFSLGCAVLVSCAPKSPAEKVSGLRAYYTAKVVGFLVDAHPAVDLSEQVMDLDGEADADVEAVGDPGDREMDADAELVPAAEPAQMIQDIVVDILLQHDSPEKLPGITLDISMVDPSKAEKAHWRVWVDTANLVKATGSQFAHILEDVDYMEGDGFSVEVRHPVPEAERGDYKEFAGLD